MPLLAYLQHMPEVGADVALADDAFVVGKVSVAGPAVLESSAVLRGDQNRIMVGPRFRIGRGSTVHVELASQTHIRADVWLVDCVVVHAGGVGDGTRVEDGGLVVSTAQGGGGGRGTAGSLLPE